MNRISKLIFLMFLCFGAIGQELTPYNCDVFIEGEKLIEPFVGGLNLPQTYAADLNNDGIEDLVILDRAGNTIIPYIRTNEEVGLNLKYAPEYRSSFKGVREWMVLRDFNADGIMDLFGFPQGNLFGIEVRKGFYSNDTLRFNVVSFNEINGAPDIIPVPSSNGSYTNLYVGSNDQPEIYDVDGDGDMDVLTFDVGGSYMQYWKNFTLEKGLGLDTFIMELEDPCWGKFFELETDESVKLSDDPDNCATLFTEEEEDIATNRHAGSCVTVFDNDGDGDIDLLLGDLSNRNMTLVTNGGENNEEAWMTDQDTAFPSYDKPIEIDVFNAGFYVDINNDGKRDLIASPNADAKIENYNVMWHYENKGTDDAPDFEHQTDILFVEEMLDFGSTSSPAFVDYNQDGLMDIVVGNCGRYSAGEENDSRLLYFKNQGTIDTPVFELVDNDFANYAQFQSTALTFNPCFGDLDGDGDIDMIVGDNNGYLFYSENIAGPGQQIEFAQAIYQFQNIRPGNIVHPQIADLNGDGLGDIILGERRNNADGNGKVGALIYYPNQGEIGNPIFEADEEVSPNIIAFGNVNTQTIFEISALTAPYFFFDGEETSLFTGSKNGKISIYSNIDNNLDGSFTLDVERFGDLYEGESTTVAVYDIDNDNLLEVLIGNQRGGLSFYNTDIVADVTISTNNTVAETLNIEVFPNPSTGTFSFSNKGVTNYQLYNTSGIAIGSGTIRTEGSLDLSSYPTGIYMIQLEVKGIAEWKKLVKI